MSNDTSNRLDNRPHCPHCQKLLDAFTAVGHQNRPKPGSVTICSRCVEPLEFDASMNLIPITGQALSEIDLPSFQRAQQIVREINEANRS